MRKRELATSSDSSWLRGFSSSLVSQSVRMTTRHAYMIASRLLTSRLGQQGRGYLVCSSSTSWPWAKRLVNLSRCRFMRLLTFLRRGKEKKKTKLSDFVTTTNFMTTAFFILPLLYPPGVCMDTEV